MKNRSAAFLGQVACLLMAALMGVMLLRAVTAGATAYHASQKSLDTSYAARTLVDYASAKIQSGNSAGKAYVSSFDMLPTLFIEEEYEGDRYVTAIYCYQGKLMELFALEGSGLQPADGLAVMDCQSFVPVQVSPSLIYLHFAVDGADSFGYVSVIPGEEVADQ